MAGRKGRASVCLLGCLLASVDLSRAVLPGSLESLVGPHETELEQTRVSADYRKQLERGVDDFVSWCGLAPRTLMVLSEAPARFDQLLVSFVQRQSDVGMPLWRARLSVLGCQTRWRHLRRRIPRSWDAIRSWHLKQSWGSRPPIPEDIIIVMLVTAVSWTFTEPELTYLPLPEIFAAVLTRLGLQRLSLTPPPEPAWHETRP